MSRRLSVFSKEKKKNCLMYNRSIIIEHFSYKGIMNNMYEMPRQHITYSDNNNV